MEQQCISIAKAGIVCSLPARTSIIAAANPCGGHYDKGRTVSENLKMNGALLSRFDLVFVLLDKADENIDRLLSAHVMALHGTHGNRSSRSASGVGSTYRGKDAAAIDDDPHSQWLADRKRQFSCICTSWSWLVCCGKCVAYAYFYTIF